MKVTTKKGRHPVAACAHTVALAVLLLLAGAVGWTEEGDLSRAGLSFALGLRAFEEGEHEEAARLFLEAAGYDPADGDSLHWLGLAYLRLGRPADAAARLEQSLSAARPPAAGRRRVRADLRLAHRALAAGSTLPVRVEPPPHEPDLPLFEDLPRWEAGAGVDALHDSSPGLLPEDLLVPLPGHPSLEGASADGAARLEAQVEHHPFYSRGWSLGLGLSGQHTLYREQGDLDLSLLRGTVSLAWGGSRTGQLSGPLGSTRVPTGYDRLALLIQGGGAGVWLGGDAYLAVAEGAFSLTVREAAWTATRLDLEARSSSYSEDASGALHRGGTEILAGLSQSLFRRGDDHFHLRLGVAAGRRQAGRAFDSSAGEVLAEVSVPLSRAWTLQSLGSWREDRFAHPESSLAIGGRKREDATWRLTLGSSFAPNDRLRWTVRASHVRRDSNVRIGLGTPLLDYERTTLSLGLDWRL